MTISISIRMFILGSINIILLRLKSLKLALIIALQ